MRRFILFLVITVASVAGASAQITNPEIASGMKYRQVKHLYNYKEYSESFYDRYTPSGAGIASFFIPGLGQMISGELGRGFAWLGGASAAYIVTGIGSTYTASAKYYHSQELGQAGMIIACIGLASMLTINIWSVVDAVRVAKVRNMYEQDLRMKYAVDVNLHPSVDYIQTADGVKHTAGFTFAFNF